MHALLAWSNLFQKVHTTQCSAPEKEKCLFLKLAKGPLRGPAHPDGLPKEQRLKRVKYFHMRGFK